MNLRLELRSAVLGLAIGAVLSFVANESREPVLTDDYTKDMYRWSQYYEIQEMTHSAIVHEEVYEEVMEIKEETQVLVKKKPKKKKKKLYPMTQEEIDLLAVLVYAEAGNQPDEGKEAVANVVLNRVDSETFPNSVLDVVFQRNQFTTTFDGALEKAWSKVDKSCYDAVQRARESRKYPDLIYFTAGGYGKYGHKSVIIGDHYFCTE